MSINFNESLDDQRASLIKQLIGDGVVAHDDKVFLLDPATNAATQGLIKDIDKAQETIREVTGVNAKVELNQEGDTKVVAGTPYRVTPQGWRRID